MGLISGQRIISLILLGTLVGCSAGIIERDPSKDQAAAVAPGSTMQNGDWSCVADTSGRWDCSHSGFVAPLESEPVANPPVPKAATYTPSLPDVPKVGSIKDIFAAEGGGSAAVSAVVAAGAAVSVAESAANTEVAAEPAPIEPELEQEFTAQSEAAFEPAAELEVVPELEPELVAEVEPDVLAEVEPDVVSEVEPDVVSEVEAEVVAEVEPDVLAEVEPDVVSEVEAEAVAEVEPDVVAEVEPDVLAEVEPDVGAEVEPEVVAEGQPEVVAVVEPEVVAEAEAGLDAFIDQASEGEEFSNISPEQAFDADTVARALNRSLLEQGGYVLQIASFSTADNAERGLAELTAPGATIIRTYGSSGDRYIIVTGHYVNTREAQDAANTFQQSNPGQDYWIRGAADLLRML